MSSQQAMQPMSMQKQSWKNDFIDCFSPIDTCLLGCFCPCMLYGKISDRLKNNSNQEPDCINGGCFGWFCLSCCACQWVIQMMTRGEVRNKYNLTGNGGIDCLTACCLPCCDLVQMDKELADRANLLPTVSTQPEKAPTGMDYMAPQQPSNAYNGVQSPPQHVYQQQPTNPTQQPIEYQTSSPPQHVQSELAHDSKPITNPPGY